MTGSRARTRSENLSALIREIRESPDAVRRTLEALADRPPLAARTPVLLAGSGTSGHAAELAAGWLRAGGVAARAEPATEEPDLAGVGTVVAVSQSGTTASILRLLDRAAGLQRVVVTNEAASPAAGRAERAYCTRAGPETAIPASKTFTAALAALMVLAGDLGGDAPDPADASASVAAGVEDEGRLRAWVEPLPPRTGWFFLAPAPLMPLAREAALKMMETALLPAFALPPGELAHGPAALLSASTPVVTLDCPVGKVDAPRLGLGGGVFRLAPAIQLLACIEGSARKLDVDAPPGLTKSVLHD